MKKLLLGLMLLLSVSATSQSKFGDDYLFASDNFIQVDHQYHVVLGGIFAVPGYFIGLDITDGDRPKAIAIGTGIGTGVNILKETTDIGKTGFNTTDVLWGALGAYTSAWLTDKVFYNNWRDNKRREIEELGKEYQASLTDEEKLLQNID